MSTYTDVTPRRPEQPGPDLADYELVHRAMTTDVRRLAQAVERIARGTERSGEQRTAAVRDYITGIGAEIRSHHQVEDDDVWPFLVALCGPIAELAELTSEHHELDPMLDAADKLAGQLATWPADLTVAGRLAQLLAELSALLDRHVDEEERDVFPLIRRYATVRDYRRLQRRFRGNLSPRTLSFVVPWAVSHATAEERPRILADAGWPLRLVLRVFAGRFAAQQRLVFCPRRWRGEQGRDRAHRVRPPSRRRGVRGGQRLPLGPVGVMTVFVLVHGGWHGGWCWRRLVPLLRADGHDVHAPTLTGLGDRAHLAAPDTGLATHVEDVVARLECEDLREVVLVGHSSSGAVITGVAQRAAERLAGLVYLDGFVPQPGQSVFDLLAAARREYFRALVDGTGRIVLDWDVAMDGWAVREARDRAWLSQQLRPHPLGGLADPLPPDPMAYLPRHFLHCTDKPSGDSFAGFAATARDDPAWRLDLLDTGHDAMVSAPQRLARILLDTYPEG